MGSEIQGLQILDWLKSNSEVTAVVALRGHCHLTADLGMRNILASRHMNAYCIEANRRIHPSFKRLQGFRDITQVKDSRTSCSSCPFSKGQVLSVHSITT